MTQQEEQQKSKNQKHMFPSLPENINYIENKLCHSDDIKIRYPFSKRKRNNFIYRIFSRPKFNSSISS